MFVLFSALPAGAEDASFYLGNSFDSTSKSILALGLVATLSAHPYDQEVRAEWRGHQKMSESSAHLGDLLGSGVPGALIALGQYRWDRENGINHIKTLIGSGVYTSALKVIANRQRPGGSSNRLSFPSGHTSSAFATATSLYMSYGYEVGVPAYLVAVGVGASRLADDVHWFSDTVAGATIGIWMGYAYSSQLISQSSSQKTAKFQILPSVENDAYFVNVLSQF